MDISLQWLQNKFATWITPLFFLSWGLCLATALAFGMLFLNVRLEQGRMNQLDEESNASGDAALSLETRVANYQKKIHDFTLLIENHTNISNLFAFLEEKTLPDVWFSSLSVSQAKDELVLLGKAKNMEVAGDQVHVFEESKKYVKSVTTVSTQKDTDSQVGFTLNILLDPKIFESPEPVVALTGATSSSDTTKTGSATLQAKPYTSLEGDFAIKVPQSWSVDEHRSSDALVVFSNTKGTAFHETIKVASGNAKGLSLSAYVQNQKNALPSVFGGWQLHESRLVKVGDRDAYLIGGTFTQNGLVLRDFELIVLKNNVAHIVTATTLQSDYDANKDILTSSLLTFLLL